MAAIRTRTATVLVAAVIAAGGVLGTAMALGTDTAEDPLTRAQVYKPGMTLREIQLAATGEVGEVAPPCPPVAAVDRLKAAGLAFGPCDPLPEEGAPFIIPDPDSEPPGPAETGEEVCPSMTLGKAYDLEVTVACAVGAEIVDIEPVGTGSDACARVTFLPEEAREPVTDSVCAGETTEDGLSGNSHEHAHDTSGEKEE